MEVLAKVDKEVMTDIQNINIGEIVENINLTFNNVNDVNTALLSNQQLINFINQLDKYIPCIPQVDDIIQKLYDNFTDIFVEIKDRYQKYIDNNINECNLDVILSLECEFELISKIPCPFRSYFIKLILIDFGTEENIVLHIFETNITNIVFKVDKLVVLTRHEIFLLDASTGDIINTIDIKEYIKVAVDLDPTG